MRRPLLVVIFTFVAAPLGGCSLGYYWQAVSGHWDVMRARQPIAELVADPATPAPLRGKLELATALTEFAHTDLRLPDNGSYSLYADIGRSHVVWNVFAAPEFSIEAETWCFVAAGCVSYRGYFSRAAAERFAARLARQGFDTFVGGVSAYSTLGRFKDPLLSNVIALPAPRVAALIFHELAHQVVYVQDDSTFNESFASFVEREGVAQWLARFGTASMRCEFVRLSGRRAAVQELIDSAREELVRLYRNQRDPNETRERKAEILDAVAARYRSLREHWSQPPYFDGWFSAGLNNARLVALSTYARDVEAFAALFAAHRGNWDAFYIAVADLAALPAQIRRERLDSLNESAATGLYFRGECPESKDSDL